MDSMLKIGKFLATKNMPRRLKTMKTRIWGCYRKRILFHMNEMCKHTMKPAHYGHMSIDEEMYCASNILVAHYNMNQVVIYLTSTIGNVHNISIKSAQFNSSDTVAMGLKEDWYPTSFSCHVEDASQTLTQRMSVQAKV